uniref:Tachykinin precursor 4 n=1 Tax=Equus asinus asinus TaxID=83772 RepID=A0A8C4MHM0_EQUAS
MLLSLTLLLLMGLSTCAVAGDEELTLSAEAGSWVTVTLEEGVIPSIQLQLQEVKRGKARQFFGLMGKRVGGEFFGLMGRQAAQDPGSITLETDKTPLTTVQVQNSSQEERTRTTGQSESPYRTFPSG